MHLILSGFVFLVVGVINLVNARRRQARAEGSTFLTSLGWVGVVLGMFMIAGGLAQIFQARP